MLHFTVLLLPTVTSLDYYMINVFVRNCRFSLPQRCTHTVVSHWWFCGFSHDTKTVLNFVIHCSQWVPRICFDRRWHVSTSYTTIGPVDGHKGYLPDENVLLSAVNFAWYVFLMYGGWERAMRPFCWSIANCSWSFPSHQPSVAGGWQRRGAAGAPWGGRKEAMWWFCLPIGISAWVLEPERVIISSNW